MISMKSHIWLRAETKDFERRTPLMPNGARELIEAGHKITVEKSHNRIIEDQLYEAAGCEIAPTSSWRDAPKDSIILGLKELSEDSFPLTHRHIYFGHAYKGQAGSAELLARFNKGSGALYDLEYLIENNRRVAAFGFWAGFAGAAAVIDAWCDLESGKSASVLQGYDHQSTWINSIKSRIGSKKPKVMVVGAKGRCGNGAVTLLNKVGVEATKWDFEETKEGGPFKEIAKHDIFINTALITKKIPPFITEETLRGEALSIICDVSCDPNSDVNPIPLYDHVGTWKNPLQTKMLGGKTRHILAVDNLPSLLPLESSEDFAEQLLPHLKNFANDNNSEVWKQSLEVFKSYSDRI